MIKERVDVEIGERSYPILIGRGTLDELGGEMSRYGYGKRIVVVTNTVVGNLYRDRAVKSLEGGGFEVSVIEIPDGENYKTLGTVSRIYDRLIEFRAERKSTIVALGGGVVGDIAGFVAATYLRGIPYIQVPTTLLAQVDSSVGGKTGVNHPNGKNLIGAFYQPRAVVIDADLLKTLDGRDIRAGMAEVIKYGIIMDRDFYVFLNEKGEDILSLGDSVLHAIKRSCEVKAGIVSADEREGGIRAILNFGHTFGHAIETVTDYKLYRHGEAVAIGMVIAGELSWRLGLCDEDVFLGIKDLVMRSGLPWEAHSFSIEGLIDIMEVDKKVIDKKLRFILVENVGKVVTREISRSELLSLGRSLVTFKG